MNVYGELTRAQIQLSGSDLSPAVLGLVYFDTSALVAKVYNGSAWKHIVDTTTSQVLTNKDYDGGTASNTSRITLPKASSATLSGLTRKAGTMVFDTSVNKAFIDDGTNLNAFGSGSGEINLVDNGSDSNSWAVSGGGIAVATSTSSSDLPLVGVFDTCLKITPASGTDYAYYRFTMPEALKGRKLKITWHQRPLSGYASGDIKVEMYKNAASDYSGAYTEFALSTDSSGTSSVPNLSGQYTTYFDADSGDYYEIRFSRTAGTTALNISGLIVGPGIQPQGSVVAPWSDYSSYLSYSGITTTGGVIYGRRVGDTLHLKGRATISATAASACYLAFSGITVDSSKCFTTSGQEYKFGEGNIFDANGTAVDGAMVFSLFYNSGDNRMYITNLESSSSREFTQRNGSSIFNTTDEISWAAIVPISEWAGGGTVNLSQNDVEYAFNTSTSDAADTTSFGYGPNGTTTPGALTAARDKTVSFLTPIQVTDSILLEYSPDRISWTEVGQSANGLDAYHTQNTASYGMGWYHNSSTSIKVSFGQYRNASGATFGAAGNSWGTSFGYWRVKKIKSGNAVGFGIVSENAAGLIPSTNTSLDNAAATRLGFKTYSHGTTYNGGIAPTVTLSSGGGTLTTVHQADFIPYQMQSGSWGMKFRIDITVSSAARTEASIDVVGVVTKNSGSILGQSFAGSNNTAAAYISRSFAAPNGNNFKIVHASQTTTAYSYTGDIALESKPTWAY